MLLGIKLLLRYRKRKKRTLTCHRGSGCRKQPSALGLGTPRNEIVILNLRSLEGLSTELKPRLGGCWAAGDGFCGGKWGLPFYKCWENGKPDLGAAQEGPVAAR